jgi:hypothetical protein
MGNISTSINLASLVHTVKLMKNKEGKETECLVIPIELNHLFKGEKGLYLNLIGFELKEPSNKKTHSIKQSFPKEYLEKLTKDEIYALPIFGNHLLFGSVTNESVLASAQSEDDDLPF